MKIGIIALSLNKTATPGYYNSQELGLGKALAAQAHSVTVYKLISKKVLSAPQTESLLDNLQYVQLPASSLGINGFFPKKYLDASMDVLICFSDTQLYTASVAKWCRKHGITFYPYIGVINSASTNALYKRVMDVLTKRLVHFYRRQPVVFAKTPAVTARLHALGVSNAQLVPIGLDTTLLKQDYAHADRSALKKEWGYESSDRILLFIGRLTPEKEPLEMIRIFADAYEKDSSLRLCMVGKGELQSDVESLCNELHVKDVIKILPAVPNKQVWELYRISDYSINLNHHEIYGMTLLEAMYYECPVIANHAPGPDFIIGELADNPSAPVYLVDSNEEIIAQILTDIQSENCRTELLHERIEGEFVWERIVDFLKL